MTAEVGATVAHLFEGFPHDRAWATDALRDPRTLIVVDDAVVPKTALLCPPHGVCLLAGGRDDASRREFVADLVRRYGTVIRYLSVENGAWEQVVLADMSGHFEVVPRVSYALREERFRTSSAGRGATSAEIRLADPSLVKLIREVDPVFDRFWRDEREFVSRGIGCCAVVRNEIASVAWSAFEPRGLLEIAVATAKGYRGQGLATAVARGLVDEAFARGMRPHWTTNEANRASCTLAEHLGFEIEERHNWLRLVRSDGSKSS